jgi:hypothetical protein
MLAHVSRLVGSPPTHHRPLVPLHYPVGCAVALKGVGRLCDSRVICLDAGVPFFPGHSGPNDLSSRERCNAWGGMQNAGVSVKTAHYLHGEVCTAAALSTSTVGSEASWRLSPVLVPVPVRRLPFSRRSIFALSSANQRASEDVRLSLASIPF